VQEGGGLVLSNPNINQLLNEHDSVTLVVKTLTKITREHRKIVMGTKYGARKQWPRIMAQMLIRDHIPDC
jgi:hypothetical protein